MKFKRLTALSVALSLGIGVTVQAATSLPSTEKDDNSSKKIELKQQGFKGKRHGGLFRTAEQMGISKEELKEAKSAEKNFFELAKQKGYTEQQARNMLIKNKTEALDKAVEEGKISKEKAEEIKGKTKENISKWDGKLKSHKECKEKDKKDNIKENKQENKQENNQENNQENKQD